MCIFKTLRIFFVTGSLNKSHSGNTVSESSDNGMIAGITIVVALVVSAAVGTVIKTFEFFYNFKYLNLYFRRYTSATSISCTEI